MTKLLFVCSQNKLRSLTAEAVFNNKELYPDIQARSAGIDRDAECMVEPDDIFWADMIVAMEMRHKNRLQKMFTRYLKDKKIHVLNIPDEYDCMDNELIELLKKKMRSIL